MSSGCGWQELGKIYECEPGRGQWIVVKICRLVPRSTARQGKPCLGFKPMFFARAASKHSRIPE